MSEHRSTTVKTEYRDGKKIVTRTETVTTLLEDQNENQSFPSFRDSFSRKSLDSEPQASVSKGKFEEDALKAHNYYRQQHKVPALTWSKDCQRHAQEHAEKLIKTNTFMHSSGKYGENLYSSWSSRGPNVSAESAIKSWYDEIKDFSYGQPSPANFSQIGHFTQVVWKGSTEVGMAFAVKDGRVIMVANYLPRGNVMGHFHENVMPR